MKRYRAFQYELLRPSEVKSLQKQCLVAYIPVGSLEWHGVQNPLGTDGLKAYAICCEAALRYGGVVLPALFLGILGDNHGWEPEGWSGFTVTANDWKILVGVTGHDVNPQCNAIHEGIQRACKETEAKGFEIKEEENWQGGISMRYSMDHAGA